MDDGKWPLVFEYDQGGLLKTEHQGWASLHYRYDDLDRLTGMVLPDGQSIGYKRDPGGLLAGIDLNGAPLSRHRLSSMGDEIERTQGDLLSAYVYDEQGRLTQHRLHQQRVKDVVAQRDYQYAANGNLQSIQDSRKGLREYVYDPMDRLVGVRGDLYEQLIHDPAGNLLEQNQGASTENRANVRGNRLTMHGDCHYEYDEFGNLTEERRGKGQKLVTRYIYDCEHRLSSVIKPDGSTWHYEYDAFGRRIAKTNGLTRTEFLWQGDRLIAEEIGDQYRTYIYEPDSFKALALVDGYGPEQARIYYYHLDHLGTPQELTNTQGDLVWSVTYRAYGNVVRAVVQEIDNPLRFQGQYYDPETGLHYNRHRYYNPNTGRFQTPDPIGLAGGLNNYQYVPNPTGWVDPLGLVSQPKNGPESDETGDDVFGTIAARDEEPDIPRSELVAKNAGQYIPDAPLAKQRVNGQDIPLPLEVAEGRAHTALGSRVGSDGKTYRQSAEFPVNTWPKANGKDVPLSEVHWTNHGRGDHGNPHQHPFIFDGNGWIRQGGNGLPFNK